MMNISSRKRLKIPKEESEAVIRSTDNKMPIKKVKKTNNGQQNTA
jgi:hypothetical protein